MSAVDLQTSPVKPPGHEPVVGLWFPLRWLMLVWLMDVTWVVLEWAPNRLQTTTYALLTSACLTLVVGLLAGVVLAVLCGLWARSQAADLRPRRWLMQGDLSEHAQRGGILLAACLLCVGTFAAAFMVNQVLIIGMARPHFTALAVVSANVVLAVAALALLPAVQAALTIVAVRLQPRPRLGWIFRRTWRVAAALGLVTLLAGSTLIYILRVPLSFLPWTFILQATGAMLLAVLWIPLRRRWPRPQLSIRPAIRVGLGLFIATVALPALPGTAASLKVVADDLLSGTLTLPPVRLALDLDGDRHVSYLGAGDCAPLNEDIHPGAIDVPENGLDEDCDGVDLMGKGIPDPKPYSRRIPNVVPNKPHVVFITVDGFAARRMAAFGGKKGLTPKLDAFAKRSVVFRNCFSQGPSTRLSFPSMFASRWDSQIKRGLVGKHPYPVDASEVMLAELMREEGYQTAAVVSNTYFSKRRWKGLTSGFSTVVESPFRKRPRVKHNSHRVTEAALALMKRKRERPLFLWVHYYDAHAPFVRPKGIKVKGRSRQARYDAELKLVDREVGRLLEMVKKHLGEEALVIVSSDHGTAFDKPRHRKRHYGYDLYTVTLHVPLLIQSSYIRPRVVDSLVGTMDVAPTILNLLRLGAPPTFRGESLAATLFGAATPTDRTLVHQFYLNERNFDDEDPLTSVSLRNDRLNLIHDRKHGTYELYEWSKDYLERKDLSTNANWQGELRRMRDQLSLVTYELHAKARLQAKARLKADVKAKEEAAKKGAERSSDDGHESH